MVGFCESIRRDPASPLTAPNWNTRFRNLNPELIGARARQCERDPFGELEQNFLERC